MMETAGKSSPAQDHTNHRREDDRMKHLKRLTPIAAALALTLALSACGSSMTAETLTGKMAAALADTPMTQATASMEFDMAMTIQGESTEMSMAMDMDLKTSADPYAAYTQTEVTVDVLGSETTETSQTYTLEENGSLVSYTHSDSGDTWLRQDMGMSLADMSAQSANYNWLTSKAPADLTLDKDTQKLDGHQVYVLSCTLTGTEMQEALQSMGSLQDTLSGLGVGEMDLTALSVPTTFYVDTKTFLPVRMELQIEGMGDVLSGMMNEMFGPTGLQIEFDVGTVQAVYSSIGYDQVEVPGVPAEGLANAIDISY